MGFDEASLLKPFLEMAGKPAPGVELGGWCVWRPNYGRHHDMVREFKDTGPAYRQQLHTMTRSAYRSNYRAMLLRLLNTLEFRSNNEIHRPVLDVLAIVKWFAGSGSMSIAKQMKISPATSTSSVPPASVQGRSFFRRLKRDSQDALTGFYDGLAANQYVKVVEKNLGRIRLPPFPVQIEPANLGHLRRGW